MSNGKISGVITSDSKVKIKTNLDGVKTELPFFNAMVI